MKQINLDWAAGRRNPSGLHAESAAAARGLQAARQKVATALAARSDEIIFTSGGTESNNLAIFGLVNSVRHRMSHILTTAIEHASVREPCRRLNTTFLPVNQEGFVDLKQLAKSLRRGTALVSIIYAHNEIGVIQPIREIAKIIRRHRQKNKMRTPYLHIDACQAPRFLDLNAQKLGVDLMTLNGGKLGAPGAGSLFVRRGINLRAILLGGGQERGLRSGTENVAAISQFADALERAQKNHRRNNKKASRLRDDFIAGLLALPGVTLNGPKENRLANNINVSFADLDGEQIVLELDAKGIAASTGAACAAPERDASPASPAGGYVIMALGKSRSKALGAVRFTLGDETTKRELNYVLKVLPPILRKLNSVKNLNKII